MSDMFVVFARETAVGLNSIEILNHKSQLRQLINFILNLNSEIKTLKEELVSKLFLAIQTEENPAMKNELLNLKRAIYNERDISKYLDLHQELSIEQKLEMLNKVLQQRKHLIEKGKIYYSTDIKREIFELEKLAHSPDVLNGILFSSRQLFESLAEKELISLKKNKGKIINQVCKFVLRSATKTTPFSSFNSTFCIDQSRESVQQQEHKSSRIQFNNLVYLLIKRLFYFDINLLKLCEVELNPSIKQSGVDYEYFISVENCDQLRRLKSNTFVTFINDLFIKVQFYSLDDLSKRIVLKFDSTYDSALQYLHSMVSKGILLPLLPVSIYTSEWPKKLMVFLDKHGAIFSDVTIINPMYEFLFNLDAIRVQLEQSIDISVRYGLLVKAEEVFLQFIAFIKKDYPDLSFVEKIENLNYTDLFYEDNISHNRSHQALTNNDVEKLSKIDIWCSGNIRNSAFSKIIGNKLGKKIPFLKFYMHYCSHIEEFEKEYNGLVWKTVAGMITDIVDDIKKSQDAYIIPTSKFFLTDTCVKNVRLGVFFQKKNKSDQLIINSVTDGCGKNIARFLQYSSPEVVEGVKGWVQEMFPNMIVADVKDCSIHNVNMAIPLAEYVIKIPGAEVDERFSKDIPLSELVVETESMSLLWRGKKVIPFHFSMEGINRKSTVFKLLVGFDSVLPIHQQLIASLEEIWRTRLRNSGVEILFLPQLQIDKSLIINRKKWFVQKKFFDEMGFRRFGDSAFFEKYLGLIKWQKENGIPDEVFVKCSNSRVSGSNQHKPQYLDFKSPLLVENFCFELKKADDIIEIVEAMPNSQSVGLDEFGEKRVREYLLNL